MALFEDGPTTTRFEQLIAAGIELPDPDAIADADVRSKLWQVLAELAKWRTFLNETNHLSGRELYALPGWRAPSRPSAPWLPGPVETSIGATECPSHLAC
jgi:hypothetical protein